METKVASDFGHMQCNCNGCGVDGFGKADFFSFNFHFKIESFYK